MPVQKVLAKKQKMQWKTKWKLITEKQNNWYKKLHSWAQHRNEYTEERIHELEHNRIYSIQATEYRLKEMKSQGYLEL